MADPAPAEQEDDDVPHEIKPGITRTGHADGSPPTYEDHRDFVTKMHGALGALLGTGERRVGPQGKPLSDAVDEAVGQSKGDNSY